jgi:hypothetical protein
MGVGFEEAARIGSEADRVPMDLLAVMGSDGTMCLR